MFNAGTRDSSRPEINYLCVDLAIQLSNFT